jgi:hypothetical protein
MRVLDRTLTGKQILGLLAARNEAVTTQYRYAIADDRKTEAEGLAETKLQLAELKLAIVDALIE